MIRRKFTLPAPARQPNPRPWAHRVRARTPMPTEPSELQQVASQLPSLVDRMHALGLPLPEITLHRQSLTLLQQQLRDATLDSVPVAQDPLIQSFRKLLHLLLDH